MTDVNPTQFDYAEYNEVHLREILSLWQIEEASCRPWACSGLDLARRKIATIEAELRRRAQGGPKL